jgi:phosphotransferase system  glucose/maltose/N-acetylglucosamine-specific IIC component
MEVMGAIVAILSIWALQFIGTVIYQVCALPQNCDSPTILTVKKLCMWLFIPVFPLFYYLFSETKKHEKKKG